jgi:asparagine synthase (glutamine-hydrolysing)
MCGICGFINLRGQPVDATVGQHMIDLLWHRGPDGHGSFVSQKSDHHTSLSIFLGHRRLKIIDLSNAAQQPLPNEDETVWVIFNGEIYNFLDLRRDLQQRGHIFRSLSDTESIVHAYEEFGDDFVQRLDGMFAFALWDGRHGRLILARDRSGKKPLFYTCNGTQVTFASEIKALLACPWVKREIAFEHLPEFFTFGYVPTPNTLYHGIFQVPPASYVVVNRTGIKGPYRYWQVTFSQEATGKGSSLQETTRHVRDLLTQAVERRLICDVPLGALLSGGLDSSIVVGIMSQLLMEPVRTFTIGFADDQSFDERSYAAIAARHFRTDHTEFVVNTDTISLMELLLWHHDQPYGDSSAIPTYLVSKLARQQVTVVLNGDGGDEVFGGYDRFLAALMAERIPRWLTPLGYAIARFLPVHHGYHSTRRRLERFLEDADSPVEERFLSWISFFNPSRLRDLFRPEVAACGNLNQLHGRLQQGYRETQGLPLLHRLLYLNFTTYLPDDLHVKMDRMSMANALETRSPMLDTALVEFVASLPPDLKIHRTRMKYVLKMAFRDMLPPELLNRRKHGFGVPLGYWFRHQLRSHVEETLLAPNARLRDYFNQNVIRTLFQEHVEGIRPHWDRLWILLNFELWLRLLEEGTLWKPRRPETEVVVDVAGVTRHSYA